MSTSDPLCGRTNDPICIKRSEQDNSDMPYNILEAQPPTLKGSALNSPTFGDANDVNYKEIIF